MRILKLNEADDSQIKQQTKCRDCAKIGRDAQRAAISQPKCGYEMGIVN